MSNKVLHRSRYRILDTVESRWWRTAKGKSVWCYVDTALDAWNKERVSGSFFSMQNRYQMRAFTIHPVIQVTQVED